MEVTECTKIVLEKIQNFEPENATKIIGYLLLNSTHQKIMEYALGNDQQILSLISEAKTFLSSSPKPIVLSPQPDQPPQYLCPRAISRSFSSPSSFRVPAPYLAPHSPNDPLLYNDVSRFLQNHAELASLEEHLHAINPMGLDFSSNYVYPDSHLGVGLGLRACLRSPTGLPEFSNKTCHYFNRGYCRLGNTCKYLHELPSPDGFTQIYGLNPNEFVNDDYILSPGSLQELEVEISQLLKARSGMPVSIASLPSMYLEKYGKPLQADGYLTESQRHGKAGFSLTRLLARLNCIQLIDKPHGQHSVVLVEDAPKYEYRNERNDSGAALPSSHQIYLTFPAESSFTDDDVLNYFMKFGPVRDVRIPRQEKRMFGFVSFEYPETVRTILTMGHPHHICGSRVLVKPYKEKTRIYDRKYNDRTEFLMNYPPRFFEMEPEPPTIQNSNLLKTQLMEEHEHVLELERSRLLGLNLTPRRLPPRSFFSYRVEHSKTPTNCAIQNNGSTSDDKLQQVAKSFSDQDSGNIELPDNPFASPPIGNNLYTVV